MQLDVFAVLNIIVVGEATLSLLGMQKPFLTDSYESSNFFAVLLLRIHIVHTMN